MRYLLFPIELLLAVALVALHYASTYRTRR
jgi:hypothetical protein